MKVPRGEQIAENSYQSQRIFVAASVTRAMQAVRREMGDHAVIIQVRKRPGEDNMVEVVASESAHEDHVAALVSPPPASSESLKQVGMWIAQYFDEVLQQRLLYTAEALAQQNMQILPLALMQQTLRQEVAVYDITQQHQVDTPVLLLGPAGTGKTSFAMKLALQHRLEETPLRLINADHKHVGNRHAIGQFAKLADIKVHHLRSDGILKKLQESTQELTIIDTPPLNPFCPQQSALVLQPFAKQKIHRLLVVSLWQDREILQDAIDCLAEHTSLDGLVVTGMDCVSGYDKMFNLSLNSGLPLAGVSSSAALVDGVTTIDIDDFTARMITSEKAGHP